MVNKQHNMEQVNALTRDRPGLYRPALFFGLLTLVLWLSFTSQADSLTQLRLVQGRLVQLSGSFGPACPACEVRVVYSDGLTYAYKPLHWHNDRIQFTIEDLGAQANVRVYVMSKDGLGNSRPFTIQPDLEPDRLHGETTGPGPGGGTNDFSKRHDDPYGGSGKDQFNVSSKPAACGKQEKRFHRAELVINKQRFGDARIIQQPTMGCQNCLPIKVEWYHEPTGLIEYQVHVQKRIIDGICPERIR
jgi:hypothetical protein